MKLPRTMGRTGYTPALATLSCGQSLRDWHAMIPLPAGTLRRCLVAAAFAVAFATAGCGGEPAAASASNQSGSGQTATPTSAGQAASGGVADTPANRVDLEHRLHKPWMSMGPPHFDAKLIDVGRFMIHRVRCYDDFMASRLPTP